MQAAQLGNVAAQYNLAYLYEQGSGVDQSESEASKWYQLAAKGGDPLAQFDIGQRYHLGLGVTANQAEAVKWLTLAAAQGQADSIKLLAKLKSILSAADLATGAQSAQTFTTRPPK